MLAALGRRRRRRRPSRGGGGRAAATAAAAAKPRINKRLIPYRAERKNDMAGYSKRHYGKHQWRLTDPKLIVDALRRGRQRRRRSTTPSRPTGPTSSTASCPGVCSHFAVGAEGRDRPSFVPVSIRCRHVVGLNHVSIGIEHVGFSDGDVLGRKPQFKRLAAR